MASNFVNKYLRTIQGGPEVLTSATSGGVSQFHNSTLITSRDQVVNAPLIAATSDVWLSPRWLGPSSYGSAVTFSIGSIMPGSGFFISTINSIGFGAAATASVSVSWQITLTS